MVDGIEPMITPPMTKIFQQLVDSATSHILRAKEQQKQHADKGRREVQFQPGDQVWIPTKYFAMAGRSKLHPRYVRPFRVLDQIGEAAYRLQLQPTMRQHPVFHVSLLQADRSPDPDLQLRFSSPSSSETSSHASHEYEVECILDFPRDRD